MGLFELFEDAPVIPKPQRKVPKPLFDDDDDDLGEELKVLTKKKTTLYELKECKICFNA